MSRRSPQLRHLQALIALTEEGSFTDAAIRLGVTQSAVSRTVSALEDLVGCRLVQRTTRSVSLTPAGVRCYHAALLAVAALEDVGRAAHGADRALRLGYAWSALGRHTSDVLRRWRTEHPETPLEIHRVDDRLAGLNRGATDIAVVRGDVAAEPDLTSRLVFREPRVVALPATHALATRSQIRLDDLREDTVVVTSYGTTRLELWPQAVRPRATLQVDNTDEWLTEIAGGLGIGVTAESTASQHAHPGVVFVPLSGAEPLPVHLVWPRHGAHPAVGAFAELVDRVVAGDQPSAAKSSLSV